LLQEALQQAVRENPDLARQFPELQSVANAAAAAQCKEAGNQAFLAGRFEEALLHFSEALSLKEDSIYYSNRAASYHALKRYREAAEDARRVVALDSKWVKGWSRLAAALFAMEEWSEVGLLSVLMSF
jgi:tetratricopeptide (TPR) repeat protein